MKHSSIKRVIDLTPICKKDTDDYYFSIFSIEKVAGEIAYNVINECSFNKIENKAELARSCAEQFNILMKENLLGTVLKEEFEYFKEIFNQDGIQAKHNFISLTNQKKWKEYFFEKYECITNLLNKSFQYFSINLITIIDRFKLDYMKLVKNNFIDSKSKIIDIELFKGDLHNLQQSVCFIKCSSNKIIVYKPRSSQNEINFGGLLTYIQSLDSRLKFPLPPDIINYKDYSWSKFANSEEFFTEQGIDGYYFCFGAITAIMHFLGTFDIMPDNFVVTRNGPVFIDLEGLYHKILQNERSKSFDSIYNSGVIRTAILPLWSQGTLDPRRNSLRSAVTLEVINLLDKHKFTINASHIPKIKKTNYPLRAYNIDSFEKGFLLAHSVFLCNYSIIRNWFIKTSFFKNTFFRAIIHDTALYEVLRAEYLKPSRMIKKFDLSAHVEEIVNFIHKEAQPLLKESIIKQIHELDIPYFKGKYDSNTLYDGLGNVVSKNFFFEKPPIELIDERVKETDLSCKYHLNIIREKIYLAEELIYDLK